MALVHVLTVYLSVSFALPSNYQDGWRVKNCVHLPWYDSTRITEEYVQVQVVNVSTGEFEGNVTVNL